MKINKIFLILKLFQNFFFNNKLLWKNFNMIFSTRNTISIFFFCSGYNKFVTPIANNIRFLCVVGVIKTLYCAQTALKKKINIIFEQKKKLETMFLVAKSCLNFMPKFNSRKNLYLTTTLITLVYSRKFFFQICWVVL